MTAATPMIVKPVNAAQATAPATKLFAGSIGTFGGMCMLLALTLLYLPAILPCVLITGLVRLLRRN